MLSPITVARPKSTDRDVTFRVPAEVLAEMRSLVATTGISQQMIVLEAVIRYLPKLKAKYESSQEASA